MKRMVQTIRNILICIILVIIYLYWNGYYLSKEKCIEDSMRSLYVPNGDKILEICNQGNCKTLIDHGNSFSLIGTKKQWIFRYYGGFFCILCYFIHKGGFCHDQKDHIGNSVE